jgi:putative transcriptional regulator
LIRHHPPDELLLDFATGAQPAALRLTVGSHLHFCPSCRCAVADLEALGGALILNIDPVETSEDVLQACLARLDEAATNGHLTPDRTTMCDRVPPALRPYLNRDLAALPWQSVGGFFDEVKLPRLTPGHRVSMVRVAPGRHVPEHGHDGNEFMLVLNGGYCSGGRHFRVGDFAFCDGSEDHTPVADDGEDCICLLVLDGPLAFRDADGRRIESQLAM